MSGVHRLTLIARCAQCRRRLVKCPRCQTENYCRTCNLCQKCGYPHRADSLDERQQKAA